MIRLIYARSSNFAIGAKGGLPWRLPEDMAFFKKITAGHTVVMGRKTWDSIPEKFRPLPGRRNAVITRTPGAFDNIPGVQAFGDFGEFITSHVSHYPLQSIWVIGGAQLYDLARPYADEIIETEIDMVVEDADTFITPVGDEFIRAATGEVDWKESTTGLKFRFNHYQRLKGKRT